MDLLHIRYPELKSTLCNNVHVHPCSNLFMSNLHSINLCGDMKNVCGGEGTKT